MNRSSRFSPLIALAVLAAVIIVAAVAFSIASSTHTKSFSKCVVTGKDRTSSTDKDGNTKSDARIYTENCGTFQVADSLLSWTFSSSDTYGSILQDHTYDFETRGYRIPFMSSFPNIVHATEVK